jgi:large subunit ribosomal protein L25
LEIFDLRATQRNTVGKGPARALRREGLIPAILYGPKRESMSLTVSPMDLEKIYKDSGTEQVVLKLVIENGVTQNVTVLVKKVQTSPVTRQCLHIDFLEISLDEEIVVRVPVEVTGKSVGVERGGFLQLVRHELEVSCLPMDMPEKIEVDIADLDIGDAIHVEDITLDDRIKMLSEPGHTVLTVVAPTVEEEELPEEEEELEEGEEAAEAGEGEPEATREASDE